MPTDPMLRKAQADIVLERTAAQLHELLQTACAELDPFPPFPNALFTHAIEIEEGPSADPDRGCVVIGEDGELYELQFGIDHDSIELTGSWDPVTARKEELKKLDLHPRDYIVFAYNGLVTVTELLMEQSETRRQG